MPNWCSNNVTFVHKDPAMIQRAHDALIRGELLSEFFPCPAELKEHQAPNRDEELIEKFISQYGASDWYNWQVNNWGTKWDVGGEHTSEKISDNEIYASFDSAWSPPTEAYRQLIEQHGFEITAYYYEPGVCFVGKVETIDGEFYDECYDYSECDASNVRDAIGDELDDYFGISQDMTEWDEDQ